MNYFPLLSEGKELAALYAQNPGGLQSASAQALTTGSTIATSGPPQVGVARVSPSAPATGIIMQAGTTPGQTCWVVNEASAANYVQMAASGTSNVADGVNNIIPGGQARLYVWDSGTNLWYSVSQNTNGTEVVAQSASAPAITNGNTITTTGVGVARVAPGGAVTGIILQSGVFPGQEVWVVNEATGANTVTFAAAGTSNVADGASAALAGLTARKFVWDGATSLWYRAA